MLTCAILALLAAALAAAAAIIYHKTRRRHVVAHATPSAAIIDARGLAALVARDQSVLLVESCAFNMSAGRAIEIACAGNAAVVHLRGCTFTNGGDVDDLPPRSGNKTRELVLSGRDETVLAQMCAAAAERAPSLVTLKVCLSATPGTSSSCAHSTLRVVHVDGVMNASSPLVPVLCKMMRDRGSELCVLRSDVANPIAELDDLSSFCGHVLAAGGRDAMIDRIVEDSPRDLIGAIEELIPQSGDAAMRDALIRHLFYQVSIRRDQTCNEESNTRARRRPKTATWDSLDEEDVA